MPAGCEVGARRRNVAKKSAHGSVSEGGGGAEGADTDDTQPLGQRVEPNRVDCFQRCAKGKEARNEN